MQCVHFPTLAMDIHHPCNHFIYSQYRQYRHAPILCSCSIVTPMLSNVYVSNGHFFLVFRPDLFAVLHVRAALPFIPSSLSSLYESVCIILRMQSLYTYCPRSFLDVCARMTQQPEAATQETRACWCGTLEPSRGNDMGGAGSQKNLSTRHFYAPK